MTRRFASYVELLLRLGEAELRIDLGRDTPFRYADPVESSYGVLVNDLDALRAEKVLAYYGRAELRDAVDLYFLAETGEQMERLMDLAARKDPGFDRYWFAVALNRAETFPDELDRWPVKMLRPFDPADLKSRFSRWARSLMEHLGRT